MQQERSIVTSRLECSFDLQDIIAITQMLIALALHYRAPIRFPEVSDLSLEFDL